MENKSDKGGFWKRQSFLLPPLTAAVVLLCQQMASSNPSGVVTVNILLLVLNFFSYVWLLRGEKSTEKSVAIAAAGFITLMAFVFNTCVAGIPTPLSDTGIFMNSLCGMWVLVAVVQGISLLIQAVLQPTVEQETGASETNVWNRLQKVGGQLKPKATNSQGMLTILKEISFRGGAVERDETDTEVTRKNLEKLENALNSEVEHTSDAVKKFYANRHLETVKQIRQKFLNTREM